jgi:hypothetical protein
LTVRVADGVAWAATRDVKSTEPAAMVRVRFNSRSPSDLRDSMHMTARREVPFFKTLFD